MNEKIASRIKDQGLLFLLVLLVSVVSGSLAAVLKENNWVGVVTAGIMALAGLGGMLMYYRFRERTEEREDRRRIAQLEATLRDRDQRVMALEGAAPPVRIITKRDYAAVLKEFNDSGRGEVLLYNIELQTFENAEVIEQVWGGLKHLTGIERVILLLPPEKVRRFERVVMRERHRFFADEANHKFYVCEIEGGAEVERAPASIAFALYRFVEEEPDGRKNELHDKAIVFILSEPFSELKPPLVPDDEAWWDYHHILLFDCDEDIRRSADMAWRQHFDPNRVRDIKRVLIESEPLGSIEPATLFDGLGVDARRRDELLAHLAERRPERPEPAVIAPTEPDGTFRIPYDNGESIEGHYTGLDVETRASKRALVWVGGFTERRATKLPSLFEKHLRQEDVAQFYYQVSPPIEFITLTRYMQDMRETIRYVSSQTVVVERGSIVLIARSINGLLAALVAAEEEFLDVLAGVILVAPVFDVVEMINNYRETTAQPFVTVEKAWRRTPGYSADRWEDPTKGWLEFFGHQVSLALLADIIRQPSPAQFAFESFKQAVGAISQRMPIYILSHPNDPITGSEECIRALRAAASGTGLIRETNFEYVAIESVHLPPEAMVKDKYPFAIKDEIREVRDRLSRVLDSVGVPTNTPSD